MPPPRHYIEARVRKIKLSKIQDRPLILGDHLEIGHTGGWLSFIPPGEELEVRLKLRPNSVPQNAVREWLVRQAAKKQVQPGRLNFRSAAALWNLGHGRRITVDDEGRLQMHGVRSVGWEPEFHKALKAWNDAGQRGPSPHHLLAFLEPDDSVPFIVRFPELETPSKERWIDVGIDLLSSLDEQLAQIRKHLDDFRAMTYFLANRPIPRKVKRRTERDILVWTLFYSAGYTAAAVAAEVFPRERRSSAERKVRDILRNLRKRLEGAVSLSPPP